MFMKVDWNGRLVDYGSAKEHAKNIQNAEVMANFTAQVIYEIP